MDVITAPPNFPEGVVYAGYRNRYGREEIGGIGVTRVPVYIAENKGNLKRIASYVSFMLSAVWFSRRVRRPDVVVATSPQFFTAIGGYLISVLRRVPFVLEIRDLWPESIVAVGAMRRNWVIKFFERLELFLYRRADHIVVVTNSFKRIIAGKGICEGKISVIKNGADLETFASVPDEEQLTDFRRRYGLEGKFVASYIGTIGMAHRADILLEAARRCPDPSVAFMVVGGGGERAALDARQAELGLTNFRLVEKQPKQMVPCLLGVSDVCVVHLRDTPLFRTVIPSKIFEAMITGTPIALGVRGEAREIVEESGAGIPFTPDDADELLAAVMRLKADAELRREMARRGREFVLKQHNREELALRYWALLRQVCGEPSPAAHHGARVSRLEQM